MKTRLFSLLFIAILVLLTSVDLPIAGTGTRAGDELRWTVEADSTDIVLRDTFGVLTGRRGMIARFDAAYESTELNGIYKIEYTHLDTGTAAADILDTALDTMIVEILTGDHKFSTSVLLHTDTIVAFVLDTIGTATWVTFDLSSSALLANVFFRIITAVADSSTGVARVGGIDYKLTWRTYGR